ncbi:BTAD domain-containing putative transcriptional regulator [Cellulomonas sp. PhB143]|uniref:ATP-binding protein n=1 Tax=Cellulomonas sp. PhB143 TaxID=2485186 RepID=UPI000F467347|nr:BTAD domain-containing putative transcriptional regulator [Cellulomonas sp. PhB143]ROS74302.1 putative ATPase [Cellulomonas sp. PhB143]
MTARPGDPAEDVVGGPEVADGVDVAVLGPVMVRGEHGLVPLRGARSTTLVVALALRSGRAAGVQALTDELWPDALPEAPRAALQNVVSRARREVPAIRSVPGGYALAARTDLDAARAVLHAARRGDAGSAALRAALTLWRGDPGADVSAGLAGELRAEGSRLRAGLEHALLAALLAEGDLAGAAAAGEGLLEASPTDEAAAAGLMRALLGRGLVADALRVFATLRESLADELGVGPGPEVRAVHEQCLRADAPATATAGAAASRVPRPGRAVGLREAPNALVGRSGDVARVESLMTTARVVTVLGPGGIGKTRLAQEVAHRAAAGSPLVAVVELASVRTSDDVGLVIASALGVRDVRATTRLSEVTGPDARGRVLERLAEPGTVLVLDNCEHVLEGASAWAADVVAGTRATVLATSRASLGLAAEAVYPLPPLGGLGSGRGPRGGGAGSGDTGAAVELFEARARAARPGVDLPEDVVVRLCRRLDGLPLAIELAAARVRSLSVAEVERRIASSFALLTSTDRSVPERHRTLHAVIAWSWDLLDDGEQRLLRRLAVLPDSFGLDVALAVGDEDTGEVGMLDTLDGLVRQSMLMVVEDPAGGGVRYRMLETVREFAVQELAAAGEQSATDAAVDRWALALVGETLGRLSGSGQVAALHRVEAEQDNLLHVLHRVQRNGDLDVLGPLFALLARFWMLRWTFGELTSVGRAVALAFAGRPVTPARAEWAAWAFLAGGSPLAFVEGTSGALRSIARLRRLLARTDVHLGAATRAYAELAVVAVRGTAEEVAGLVERLRGSDDWNVAMVANFFASQLAENRGRPAEALRLAHRSLALATEHDDAWGRAMAAQSLADLSSSTGDPAGVLRWARIARSSFEGFDTEQIQLQLGLLETSARVALGEVEAVAPVLRQMVETPDEGAVAEGDMIVSPSDRRTYGQVGLAQVAFARGDDEEAVQRMDAALAEVRTQGRRAGAHSLVLYEAGRLAPMALGTEGVPDAERAAWDRRVLSLRARTLAGLRAGPQTVDRPVLGAACLVLGSCLCAVAPAGRADDALVLLALAERLGSRQDWTFLARERHLTAALGTLPDAVPAADPGERLERARARVADAPDPLALAREVLERRPWTRTPG